MKTIPLSLSISALSLTLAGCGYQLRGIDAIPSASHSNAPHSAQSISPHSVTLNIGDDRESITLLKRPLIQKLARHGISAHSGSASGNISDNADNSTAHGTPSISVTNLQFHQYKLRGILSEIRLVISADVRYELPTGAQTHTLQATRSYQYNEGSVATGDAQGAQVRAWLYDELATRISEQYSTLAQSAPNSPQ